MKSFREDLKVLNEHFWVTKPIPLSLNTSRLILSKDINNVSSLEPQLAQPLSPDHVRALGEVEGSGSSREHAMWALKGAGVKLIIGESYAFMHTCHLVNETLLDLQLEDEAVEHVAQMAVHLKADLKTGDHWIHDLRLQAKPPTPIARTLGEERGIVPAIFRHGDGIFDHLAQY